MSVCGFVVHRLSCAGRLVRLPDLRGSVDLFPPGGVVVVLWVAGAVWPLGLWCLSLCPPGSCCCFVPLGWIFAGLMDCLFLR